MPGAEMVKWMARASAPVLVAALVGCSFTIGSPKANQPPSERARCSTGDGRLVADLLGTSLLGLFSVYCVGINVEEGSSFAAEEGAWCSLFAVPTALLATAVVFGGRRSRRCERAQSAHKEWQRSQAQ